MSSWILALTAGNYVKIEERHKCGGASCDGDIRCPAVRLTRSTPLFRNTELSENTPASISPRRSIQTDDRTFGLVEPVPARHNVQIPTIHFCFLTCKVSLCTLKMCRYHDNYIVEGKIQRSLLKQKHFQYKTETFVMFARSSADPSFNPLYRSPLNTDFTLFFLHKYIYNLNFVSVFSLRCFHSEASATVTSSSVCTSCSLTLNFAAVAFIFFFSLTSFSLTFEKTQLCSASALWLWLKVFFFSHWHSESDSNRWICICRRRHSE